MKKYIRTLLIFLLALLMNCYVHAVSAFRYFGHVTDNETHQAIVGAVVSLNNGTYFAPTDQFGRFEIKNLPPSDYSVKISCLGFVSLVDSIKIDQDHEVSISLNAATVSLSEITVARGKGLTQSLNVSDIDLALRPVASSQDFLRLVPGLFIAQHAGGGKAEQIFLRGFDCDHGTDFYISVDGMPVNMVSHAHGQGYADFHFVIPETIDRLRVYKGPYTTKFGDFSTAGTGEFFTKNTLKKNELKAEAGFFDTYRLYTGINLLKEKHLLSKEQENAFIAAEYVFTNSYFDHKQNFGRYNLFGKYSGWLNKKQFFSFDASTFSAQWDASGQIPERLIENGQISRYGSVDPSEGGKTSRTNVNTSLSSILRNDYTIRNQIYYVKYDFDLFSNFTFFLNDPVHGDEIHQHDDRNIIGYKGTIDKNYSLGKVPLETQFGIGSRTDHSVLALMHSEKRVTLDTIVSGIMQEHNLNAYWNSVAQLSSHWSMESGVRFDYFQFHFKDDRGTDYSGTKSIARVSPKLNLDYVVNSSLRFFIHSGIGFHSNDARAVVLNRVKNTLPKAIGYEAGSEFAFSKRFLVNIALWSLHLESELVYVGDEGTVETNYPTQRYGTDFSIRAEISSRVFADVDINISQGKLIGAPLNANEIPLSPRLTSTGGITYKKDQGINFSLRYRTIDSRPANETNTVVAKGYFLLDAVSQYKWTKWTIGLTIENIMNTKWNQAQFDTESRLANEMNSVSELHFTPGTPVFVKGSLSYLF
ncbi:MAG TPA: TonB-dependent receptor [Bacteroidia bacterium]|nr:TonB-dependent receptor [Bacteroidia bacterium]HNP98062.1 TonB-dependent receptor [Bacteroidia bacterium]